jgi:BolA protein
VSVKSAIEAKLTKAFSPQSMTVIDESHLHAGHSGARPGGESHFRVKIVAQAFVGMSRVERHRLINHALAEELSGRVHALAIEAAAPDEPARR